jgi:hypothetical protein
MCPKSKLISQIRKILATPAPKVRASDFMFEPTQSAADHNLAIFAKQKFN